MKIKAILLLCLTGLFSFAQQGLEVSKQSSEELELTRAGLKGNLEINKMLNDWHKAAADANAKVYFGSMTEDAIYIGTDASEYWTLDKFKKYASPYFDRGKAWDFKVISRNVYAQKGEDIAWFDELLDTDMKICRGSGIVRKENDRWKIVHYVLSMTIPNDNAKEVISIKKQKEDEYIASQKK